MSPDPTFSIELSTSIDPGTSLVVGLADPGVAGLTAADYLVNHVDSTHVGHVETHHLPDITPFTQGDPRRPIRLYDVADHDLTVLLSEVSLPVWTADPFASALAAWCESADVADVTVLHGTPFPHEETEHRAFHVATPDYRERYGLSSSPDTEGAPETPPEGVPPLAGGFLDGVIGELTERALGNDLPRTGVLVTPAHLPGPDLDAALQLLNGLDAVHGVSVDGTELRDRSRELRRYYEALAERMRTLHEGETPFASREYGEDRMFM